MPRFVISLRNEKLKTYTIISWLIIALNFLAFIYLGVTGRSNIENLPYYTAGLLTFIFFLKFVSQRTEFESDLISFCFVLAFIAWILMGFYWVAVLIFFLFLAQDISRRQLIVLFYDDRIVYPSFPKRTIQWHEVNNVVLKDTVLTIDLKDNRVYQNEVISPTSEIDFNEFCEANLQAQKK